jgi:hypothetical protein
MVKLIFTGILLLLLAACSAVGIAPSYQLVEQAIALQIKQTQTQLNQQLQITSPQSSITRLEIAQQEPLTIENLPAYHLQGTYDLQVQVAEGKLTQQQRPFELYLQQQSEGKSWRLAIPKFLKTANSPVWFTYLIPPSGFLP